MKSTKILLALTFTFLLFGCETPVSPIIEDNPSNDATTSADLNFVWYEDEFVKFQYPEGWEVSVKTNLDVAESFDRELEEWQTLHWSSVELVSGEQSFSLEKPEMKSAGAPDKIKFVPPNTVEITVFDKTESFTLTDPNAKLYQIGPDALNLYLLSTELAGQQLYILKKEASDYIGEGYFRSVLDGTTQKDTPFAGIPGTYAELYVNCFTENFAQANSCVESVDQFLNSFQIK